jgi:hypothetical protein
MPERGRRRAVLVGTWLAVLGALSSCSASTQSVPATAPTRPPAAVGTTPCYFGAAGSGGTAAPLVRVGSHPRAAIAVWKPGLNEKDCRAVLTHLTKSAAVRLAADIDRAKRFPSGKINCGSQDGATASFYFTYDHSKSQLAEIAFGGCAHIGGPGRWGRQLTAPVQHDLVGLAPAPWRRYLSA